MTKLSLEAITLDLYDILLSNELLVELSNKQLRAQRHNSH